MALFVLSLVYVTFCLAYFIHWVHFYSLNHLYSDYFHLTKILSTIIFILIFSTSNLVFLCGTYSTLVEHVGIKVTIFLCSFALVELYKLNIQNLKYFGRV